MKAQLKRTNLNLTIDEYELLKREAQIKGISTSELIRRIIDSYFENKNKMKD